MKRCSIEPFWGINPDLLKIQLLVPGLARHVHELQLEHSLLPSGLVAWDWQGFTPSVTAAGVRGGWPVPCQAAPNWLQALLWVTLRRGMQLTLLKCSRASVLGSAHGSMKEARVLRLCCCPTSFRSVVLPEGWWAFLACWEPNPRSIKPSSSLSMGHLLDLCLCVSVREGTQAMSSQ